MTRCSRWISAAAMVLTVAEGSGAQSERKPGRDAVVPGVEVLLQDSLRLIQGKRVGLITNASGRDRAGRSTIDLLFKAPDVELVALFAPEHGIRGQLEAGATIASSRDSATGLPIYSLYGDTKVPTPEMLSRIDVLVYDIQDAGARVYTYEWTMALSAEAAGRSRVPFVVLDRPDPIRGDRVEGGVLDPKYRSFVGQYPVALRYGLTPGELLRYLAGSGQVAAQVTVVPMRGWRRAMWYDQTGLPWINPSPNIRSLDALALYPGTVFFEATNLSEGRGTDKPFQLVGAAWLTDAGAVARELNRRGISGVHFDSTSRTVERGQKWGGTAIPMLEIDVTDRDALHPVDAAAVVLRDIYRRHVADWRWRDSWLESLSGGPALRHAIETDGGVERLLPELTRESRAFQTVSRPYRLY